MDPGKSYPVIENIYAGPQDSFVPKSFSVVNEMQSIAQLGFIVVQMDGMGTANRSKAFMMYAGITLPMPALPTVFYGCRRLPPNIRRLISAG
jgi:hypothetical protein